MSDSNCLMGLAERAARAGLDFLVRHQIADRHSADCGRIPFVYDCEVDRTKTLSTNWTTGVAIEALIAGHRAFGDDRYREAADLAVRYLYSLQELGDRHPRVRGVFREVTPQSGMAHPRDALTAAWALLDWYELTGEAEAMERSKIYADWFVSVGLELGYPYWTVRFDNQPWEPAWCGSFHSGAAFFLARMFEHAKKSRYREAMRTVLDFYNEHHLREDGTIHVILDRKTLACLDGQADSRYSNRGWEMMHVYNDDFGALANLACWRVTGQTGYRDAALLFLQHMTKVQCNDCGFGSEDRSVPSAGGAILIEMLAARTLGMDIIEQKVIDRAATYLIDIQIRKPGTAADGAFLGFDESYQLSNRFANLRSGAYAIMALLRFIGYQDRCYFFAKDQPLAMGRLESLGNVLTQ